MQEKYKHSLFHICCKSSVACDTIPSDCIILVLEPPSAATHLPHLTTMAAETCAQRETRVDATLEEQGRALSEQSKTLSELLLANEQLFKMNDQHSAILEELKTIMMVVSARQTGNVGDSSVLRSACESVISTMKGKKPVHAPISDGPPPVEHSFVATFTLATATSASPVQRFDPIPEPLHDRDRTSYHIGKVDFPKFDGTDLYGWLFRCEHYFEVDEIPKDMKMKIVVIHLEGEALTWHQGITRVWNYQGRRMSWETYVTTSRTIQKRIVWGSDIRNEEFKIGKFIG